MVLSRIGDFLEHVDEHTEQEILLNMQEIKNYFYDVNYWKYTKEKLEKIFKIVDRNKVLKELFKNEEKFSSWEEKLDIPEKLKFGIEIEFGKVTLDELKSTFETSTISEIMRILEVPTIISDKIINIFENINVSELAIALSNRNFIINEFHEREESLESYYMNLIGGGDNV